MMYIFHFSFFIHLSHFTNLTHFQTAYYYKERYIPFFMLNWFTTMLSQMLQSLKPHCMPGLDPNYNYNETFNVDDGLSRESSSDDALTKETWK